MAYCTKTDLLYKVDEDILIQLTDDDDTGSVDDAIVSEAIAEADAVINGYCGTKYDVPFSDVPVIVKKWSGDIAIYNLYCRRRGVPEDVITRYSAAIDALKDVSKGLVTLGVLDPGVDTDDGPEASTSNDDRMFTMGRPSLGTSGTLDKF
jgi:phage gp36-like protein